MVRRTWFLWAVCMLGGCAPGNPGLIIGGALAPTDQCLFDTSNATIHQGVLDVASVRVEYALTPLYFNQLINLGQSGASGPPRADPNPISVQHAEVELRDVTGAPLALPGLPNPYTVPATGFIPSSDGMTAGQGVGRMVIIPAIYGEVLRTTAVDTQIIAAVRAVGYTAAGAEQISPEFDWPIDVCFGCLFACVQDMDGVALCEPSCTPGQDRLQITPGACASPPVFDTCIPGA